MTDGRDFDLSGMHWDIYVTCGPSAEHQCLQSGLEMHCCSCINL